MPTSDPQQPRCTLCNGLAKFCEDEQVWRHVDPDHLVICDRYGYPIKVKLEQSQRRDGCPMTPQAIRSIASGIRTTWNYYEAPMYAAALGELANWIEQSVDICDVCCGSGNPGTGKPCVCGGTGKASLQAAGFRVVINDLHRQIEALELKVADLVRVNEQADIALRKIEVSLDCLGRSRAIDADGWRHRIAAKVGNLVTKIRSLAHNQAPTSKDQKE